MVIAYIALGSNLGDRAANIQRAIDLLRSLPEVEYLHVSPLYETEATGFSCAAPPFLNGVAEVEVRSTPQQFLHHLQAIESRLGRVRHDTQGPESRTIDLDLLAFGEKVIDEPGLRVPHPRMMQREFVLRPLADLAPDLVVPGETRTVMLALENVTRSTKT